jgi:serine/threonine protein kinase
MPSDLTPAQYQLALAHLSNGFNATAAYPAAHANVTYSSSAVRRGRVAGTFFPCRIRTHQPFMALAPGTRLGPYTISASIGAGGMGEVYRATDTNLKRAVAIKVLPDSVATDGDRLGRFQREAEVLASLNQTSQRSTG